MIQVELSEEALNCIMPNGKAARNCSPEYLRKVAALFQRVNDEMSEEQARELMHELVELNREERQWKICPRRRGNDLARSRPRYCRGGVGFGATKLAGKWE